MRNHYLVDNPAPNLPKKRGNNLSITNWANKQGLLIDTQILNITQKNNEKLKHKKAWVAMSRDDKKELIEIRRLRSIFDTKITEFVPTIIEVSYISPNLLPGFYEFYSTPKNRMIGFHDYFESQGLVLIKSTYDLTTKNLNKLHMPFWKKYDKKFKKSKHFLRMTVVTYCNKGPVEFSQSYIDPNILSINVPIVNLKYHVEY